MKRKINFGIIVIFVLLTASLALAKGGLIYGNFPDILMSFDSNDFASSLSEDLVLLTDDAASDAQTEQECSFMPIEGTIIPSDTTKNDKCKEGKGSEEAQFWRYDKDATCVGEGKGFCCCYGGAGSPSVGGTTGTGTSTVVTEDYVCCKKISGMEGASATMDAEIELFCGTTCPSSGITQYRDETYAPNDPDNPGPCVDMTPPSCDEPEDTCTGLCAVGRLFGFGN